MKTTHIRVDEVISDTAFFILLALTAMAGLNIVSIWVVVSCFFAYVVIGLLAAFILPNEPGMEKHETEKKAPEEATPVASGPAKV